MANSTDCVSSATGAKLNAKGEGSALTLVKAKVKKEDNVQRAVETIAVEKGVPQAWLDEQIAKYRKEHPQTDIPATAVNEGQQEQPAIEAQASEVRQPQNVAAQ